jgi:hypothetical protein
MFLSPISEALRIRALSSFSLAFGKGSTPLRPPLYKIFQKIIQVDKTSRCR